MRLPRTFERDTFNDDGALGYDERPRPKVLDNVVELVIPDSPPKFSGGAQIIQFPDKPDGTPEAA